jgi:hypothetical protein
MYKDAQTKNVVVVVVVDTSVVAVVDLDFATLNK